MLFLSAKSQAKKDSNNALRKLAGEFAPKWTLIRGILDGDPGVGTVSSILTHTSGEEAPE